MKKAKIILAFPMLLIMTTGFGQTVYQVGSSQVSIEPDNSLISLSFGGYAAPREGRFSLQWKSMGQMPENTSITGDKDVLYIISGNNLLFKTITESNTEWKSAGKVGDIRSIAIENGKIYAVNNNGEFLVSDMRGMIKWNRKGAVDKSVTSVAVSSNKLYAASPEGILWVTDLSKKNVTWEKNEIVKDIISLATLNNKLYALTREGTLNKIEKVRGIYDHVKIAYKNGITIKEDISRIAIAGNMIFGVSYKNILYQGEHRSDGNLTARAMAIRDLDKTVVIVNVDAVGFTGEYTGLIKQEVYKKRGIPPSGIFINAIHTHFAPVSQDWLTWAKFSQRADSNYLFRIMKNGIIKAIEDALKSMAPSELYFGRGKTDIGYNRSLSDHQELYDSSVDVLKVVYINTNTESYLFLASCHPVFSVTGKLHYTLSANFPGVARTLVEERTGTSNALFLQGTCGDINPRDNGEYITGEKLANEVIAVLSRPARMTRISGPVSFYLDTIDFPINPWTREDINDLRAKSIDKPGDLSSERNVRWCYLMLKYYDDSKMPISLPVYVNTLNIGNWKLVGFSRETTTGYSFGVKNLWPEKLISVAGYTNDVSSYLPTSMHLENRGYEGYDSFFWYGIPNVFPLSVDQTILKTIKDLNR